MIDYTITKYLRTIHLDSPAEHFTRFIGIAEGTDITGAAVYPVILGNAFDDDEADRPLSQVTSRTIDEARDAANTLYALHRDSGWNIVDGGFTDATYTA